MATMQGSGAYVQEVDESFQSFDTVALNFCVPLLTKKGEPGKLNEVSVSDLESVLGYDLTYNPNYLGLKELLGSVSTVKVLRLNKGASFGNVVIFADGRFYSTEALEDFDLLEAAQCLATKTITFDSLSDTFDLAESVKPGSLSLYAGGVLVAHDDGEGGLVGDGAMAAITGTLVAADGTGTITLPAGTTTPYGVEARYTHDSDAAILVAMKTPGDWDSLALRISRYFETLENYASSGSLAFTVPYPVQPAAGAYRVEDASGAVLATCGAPSNDVATITGTGITGTINFSTMAVSLTFSAGSFPASGYPMLLKHRYMLSEKHYLFEVLQKVSVGGSNSYLVLESARMSLIPTAEDFLDNVAFENVTVKRMGNLAVDSVGAVTPVDLLYGTNGSMPAAADIDLSAIPSSDFSMICMNGILSATVVSKFVAYAKKYNKMILADIPNVQKSAAAKLYADTITAYEGLLLYWVSDFQTIGTKKYSVYPSVKAALAYAAMFKATGYLCFPPAGYDYAGVTAEELLQTDADENGAFLKQNKINYIARRGSGPVIWEQRTRYALESDLSYASTVTTYFALASRVKAYADNYPFRYVTAELLIQLKTGIDTILNNYIDLGFVWSASAVFPSFAQVMASGARMMNIPISVKFAEDGEEYTFVFHIKAKA